MKRLIKVNDRLHKTVLTVVFTIMIVSLTVVDSAALDSENAQKIRGDTEGIIDKFEEILPEEYKSYTDVNKSSEAVGIKQILKSIISTASRDRSEYVALILSLIGVALLSSLASLHDSDVGSASSRAVGVACSALLFDRLLFLVKGSIEALGELSDFFSSVIPVCLAINTLGTSPTTATTQAVGMGITLAIYSYLSESLLLPLVSAAFVTAAVSSVDGSLAGISKGIRGAFLWTTGIFSALVGATFSLQSVISSGADNAVIRSAKYAIGGTVPIVGGTVSSALGLLIGGAGYARSIVGGGAIAAVLSLIISPLVSIVMYRLCLKLGLTFSSLISSDGCADVISSFLGAIDMLMAAYAFTSVVYIAELVAFLKGGVGYA